MKTEYQMLVSGGMDVESAITALTKQMGEWINKGYTPFNNHVVTHEPDYRYVASIIMVKHVEDFV